MATEVYCPKCSKLMKQRSAKKPPFKKFMGCPGFFPKSATNPDGYDLSAGEKQCDGVVWGTGQKYVPVVKQPLPKIKGSPQQVAIWDAMENGDTHLMVKALAGTGKTTTVVVGASKLRGSVLAVAFNNKIGRELESRMPATVSCMTFHAMGWRAIKAVYGKYLNPNPYKSLNIIDKLLPQDMEDKDKNNIKYSAQKLVSLCKNRLVEPTEEALLELCERYGVECGDNMEQIFGLVPKVLELSAQSKLDFDYDDQIWIPLVQNLALPRYDNVIVDETQDLNPCRIELIFKVAGSNGRIIIIGDEHQAIYGFTGADSEAMQTIEARLAG